MISKAMRDLLWLVKHDQLGDAPSVYIRLANMKSDSSSLGQQDDGLVAPLFAVLPQSPLPLSNNEVRARRTSVAIAAAAAAAGGVLPHPQPSVNGASSRTDSILSNVNSVNPKVAPLEDDTQDMYPQFDDEPPPDDGLCSNPSQFWQKMRARMPYYLPILRWGRNYTFDNFFADMAAGLTNGILNIGSGIINGPIAGRDVPSGLLTACFPGLFYTFIASSMYACCFLADSLSHFIAQVD